VEEKSVIEVEVVEEKSAWDVLSSRRFISSIVGMMVAFILVPLASEWLPGWTISQETATDAITTMVVTLVAGYSLQDFAKAFVHAILEWLAGKSIITED
jgi:uncharacterized ion transporter superfamily protein YfcC